MKWIKHILRPFWEYLPMLAGITFAPWWFLDKVLDFDDDDDEENEEEKKLRHYAFFWIAMYLIVQPFVLPERLRGAEGGGVAKSFETEILLLVMIIAFSLVFLLTRSANKEIKLDTFLNLVIPVLATAIFLNVVIDVIALVCLGRLGLGRHTIFEQCQGLYDYRCIGRVLSEPSGAPYALSLANSLLEGHFMALLAILYIFGLDQLRSKPQFPVDNGFAKAAGIVVIYFVCQGLRLHSNGIWTW